MTIRQIVRIFIESHFLSFDIFNFRSGRRSRSESGSPPYTRNPLALPPITRPRTMGGERPSTLGAEILVGVVRPSTMGGVKVQYSGIQEGFKTEPQISISGKGLRLMFNYFKACLKSLNIFAWGCN